MTATDNINRLYAATQGSGGRTGQARRAGRRPQPRAHVSKFDVFGHMFLQGFNLRSTKGLGAASIIDLAANRCDLNGLEVACNIIREFDGQTKANHFEYALPTDTGNVNIWRVNADNTVTYANPTADAPKQSAPVLPFLATPTKVDDPVFYHPPAPSTPPAVIATLPPQQPPPAVIATLPPQPKPHEAAPPPGWWNYGTTPDAFRPKVAAQPTIRLTPDGKGFTVTTEVQPGQPQTYYYSTGANGGSTTNTGAGTGPATNEANLAEPATGGILAPISNLFTSNAPIADRLAEVPQWAWLAAGGLAVAGILASKSR